MTVSQCLLPVTTCRVAASLTPHVSCRTSAVANSDPHQEGDLASAADYNAEAIAAQIAIVEDRIAKCRIASPIGGTVLAKYKNAGELVSMGTPLMKVANLDAMYLRAYFTSDQLAALNLGDEVEVTADFGGDQQYAYKGTVMWIASESEFTPKAIQTRNTRANLVYAVKIAVKNDGRLKVGMYGETKIINN